MIALNFPKYSFKIKAHESKAEIFDIIRKKYVALTPEEWVRQHLVSYLVVEKNYPASLMAVEKAVKYNNMNKRADVVAYSREGVPFLIAECKAPDINITEDTFQQAVRYNYALQAKYIVLTNGLTHFFAEINYSQKQILSLANLPPYTNP